MKKKFILLLFIVLLCGCGKNNQQKEVKMVKYCENGILENNKCKVVNSVEPENITCEDEDFKFNKETRKCEHTISIPANRRVGCKDEENYTLKNGACVPKSGKGASKYRINIYSCPDSGTLNGNKCDFVDEQEALFECPQGYEKNVDKAVCEITVFEEVKEKGEE